MVGHLHGPLDTEAVTEDSQRQLAEIVASQLQGALASDPGLGVIRKGCQAVHLLEHTQEDLRCLDAFKAAEILAQGVLTYSAGQNGESPIPRRCTALRPARVGLRDELAFNAVHQFGPVLFREVKLVRLRSPQVLGTSTWSSSTPTTPLDLTTPNRAATGNNS
jgi:hypothetical protein